MRPEIGRNRRWMQNPPGISLFSIALLFCLLFVIPAKARDESEFEFTGTIQALPATSGLIGDWIVSGRKVHVTTNTGINLGSGQVVIGATVQIEGFQQTDGSVTAKEIEVTAGPGSNFSFSGTVEVLPNTAGRLGDWRISGTIVHVSNSTFIKQENGAVAVGSKVDVEGSRRTDNSVDAYKIEVKSESGAGGSLEFNGTVESLPSTPGRIGEWSVSGRKVNVTSSTPFKPDGTAIAIGFQVQVKGTLRTDGSIDATEIEVKSSGGGSGSVVEFEGTVETLPGTAGQIGMWIVSGRKVNVFANTKMETEGGPVATGSSVEIKGALLGDGSINATKIEIKSSGGQPVFKGTVESLPAAINLIGDWRVSGRTVHVSVSTKIERRFGSLAISAFVEVSGAQQSDGSINATKIEVKQGPAGGAYMNYNPVSTVSAASYLDDNAPESIVAAFGATTSSTINVATTLPLPLNLGGISVIIDGRQSGLFFVSPSQINYQVPPGAPAGFANVAVMKNGQAILQGSVQISSIALSLFTANASGSGAPAGLLLRVKSNGQQVYEALARFDAQNNLVPAPIVRRPGEQLFLILFGTGLKQSPNSDGNPGNGVAENIQVTIGGVNAPVLFAGSAPGFVGLEQINIGIPDNVPANPSTQVLVKARDLLNNLKQANAVTISLQ